jgi:hypothetical protein
MFKHHIFSSGIRGVESESKYRLSLASSASVKLFTGFVLDTFLDTTSEEF